MVEIKTTDGQTNWVSKRFANREAALAAGADARRRFASREEALQAGANVRTLTLEDGAKTVIAYRPVWHGLGEAPPNEPTDFIPRAQTPWTIEVKTADGEAYQISKRFASRDAALRAGAELLLFTRKDDPIELATPIVAYRPIWESPGEPPTPETTEFIPIATPARTPADAAPPPTTSDLTPPPTEARLRHLLAAQRSLARSKSSLSCRPPVTSRAKSSHSRRAACSRYRTAEWPGALDLLAHLVRRSGTLHPLAC